MDVRKEKLKAIGILVLTCVLLFALILSTDFVSAEDSQETSEPVVARAIEVYDSGGPTYIGVVKGETYIPYGLRVNLTTGNSSIGYTKRMGMPVFYGGTLQEGYSYSQGEPKNGRMPVTISYTAGGVTVSDTFEVDVIDDSNATKQAEDGYYEIGTAEELATFSLMVGAAGKKDINARLTADIDMSETEFQPIGQYYTDARRSKNTINDGTPDCIWGSYFGGYSGTFDGNGKTVNFNLTARRCAALIGIAEDAVVKNVTITGTITAQNTGYSAVGAGVVALVTNDCGLTVENCVNKADITSGFLAGGVVGNGGWDADIIGCTNEGNVTGQGGDIGGVAGVGNVKDCVNHGDVYGVLSHIGGVVGGGSATGCLNTGKVEQEAGKYTNVGGIIGVMEFNKTENCVNTGNVTGPYSVGGIAGMGSMMKEEGPTFTNCYNYGTISCNYENNSFGYGGIGGIVGILANTHTKMEISQSYNLGAVVY